MKIAVLLLIGAVALPGAVVLPGAALAQTPPSTPTDAWPQGAAHDIVPTLCTACHEGRRFTAGGGYTEQGWQTVLDMMKNIGAPIPPDRVGDIKQYLVANWPEKPKPKPVLIAGPVQVEFKSWPVPTPGSRPHDPLATPDGAIWWSGQSANKLGRLDPATGEMKEFPLKSPLAGPHGLIADKFGHVWYAANWGAHIGALDPKTGEVVEFKMPDPKARDPHTPLFDKGEKNMFFTLQTSNMVGRMNMETKEIKLVTMPAPRSQPYGIVFDSKGTVWFEEFGAPRLASLDPVSLELKEYTLPNPETRPRRLAITSDDKLWYTDYSRGALGMYDTRTGAMKDWPSPSGPKTQPYGITVLNDIVWYVEGNAKPNVLVRFDPQSEKFQTWEIPTGGGVVRNMMPSADGKSLVIAESGVNRVGLITIR